MDDITKTLQDFMTDYCDYLPRKIPVLTESPTAVEFLRKYVIPNSPFIIKPPGKGFFPQAQHEWKANYRLMEILNCDVTVATTPDGKGDTIVDDKYMVPEERRMWFFDYVKYYFNPEPLEVMYTQKKNNLIEEFSGALPLLSKDVPWATEAFGHPPDEANFWMGDNFSTQSMRQDHYENIIFVVRGYKIFRIFPPVAIAWMPYRKVPKFQWVYTKFWQMKDLHEEVMCIKPDLQPDTHEKYKMFHKTRSYTITISPGEALYLPSMWFHEASQTSETIAVNYLYEMTYEMKFPYFRLIDTLANLPNLRKDVDVGTQPELEDQLIEDIMPRKTARGFKRPDLSKKKF